VITSVHSSYTNYSYLSDLCALGLSFLVGLCTTLKALLLAMAPADAGATTTDDSDVALLEKRRRGSDHDADGEHVAD